jgi:hypothetical protein
MAQTGTGKKEKFSCKKKKKKKTGRPIDRWTVRENVGGRGHWS